MSRSVLPWTGLRTNTLRYEDSIFLHYLAPGSYRTMAFQQLTKLYWYRKIKQTTLSSATFILFFMLVCSFLECRPETSESGELTKTSGKEFEAVIIILLLNKFMGIFVLPFFNLPLVLGWGPTSFSFLNV